VTGLARAQIGQKAYERAHATLRAALQADPGEALLWAALAELLCAQGRHGEAVVFFEEAVRLDPASAAALDGLADALLLGGGDETRGLAAGAEALVQAEGEALPGLTANQARRLLALGQLEEGWTAFGAAMAPGPAAEVVVKIAAPRWRPREPLAGRLLLIGEADIVDEVLFSRCIPALLADGQRPILALQPNWEALARRSFPQADFVHLMERRQPGARLVTAALDSPHVHGGELVGAWTPLRALLAAYGAGPGGFASADPYLKVDGDRIAHWRERLAGVGDGLKVGVVWRAPGSSPRAWEAPPLPLLNEALSAPDLHLIGVQAEDIQGELAWIRSTYGLPIHDPPPELKLWDLDDLAALACALDVVVGLPDAAAILAAGAGARAWFLSPPRHWARLGGDAYPWFPQARVFAAAAPNDWTDALAGLQEALAELAAGL
jgi:tetratricopeptide (TPR) repeat protein